MVEDQQILLELMNIALKGNFRQKENRENKGTGKIL